MDEQIEIIEPTVPRYPVDITEEEFIRFSKTVAKYFGALRTRTPMLVCFIVYMALIIFLAASELADTGTLSWPMILMSIVAIVSALPALIINPIKVKKSAKAGYHANEENGYYGEIYFENGEIVKDVGYKQTRMPLSEQTLYIETADFMAFCAARGNAASIVIPARCVTEEMASAIRKEVFRPEHRLQRRVVKRMIAGAVAPIAQRAMCFAPTVLYETSFTYTPEELADIITYTARQNYVKQLPSLLMTAMLLGAVMVLMMENVWAFVVAVPAVFLLSLLISSLNAAAAAKRTDQMPPARIAVTITDRGIDQETVPAGRAASVKWRGVMRATEAETYVEFAMNGGMLLRIPKREIDDMDAFRAIVDRYYRK